MPSAPISALEKEIGYRFQNSQLITDALTHSSTGSSTNYERLEFLGDRVLGLAIAGLLFEKFPSETEGDMARRLAALVEGTFLAQIARTLSLGEYVEFSPAERAAGGAENENILADVFEAVIGALYLDSGFQKCADLIGTLWSEHLYTTTAPPQHPKTTLQEWAQERGLALPEYEITDQSGPDHAPVFDVTLRVEGYPDVIAQGRSRQVAEKMAASAFLENLEHQKS